MTSSSNAPNQNLDVRIKQEAEQIDVYYDAQEYRYTQERDVPNVCQSQQDVQIHDDSNDTQLTEEINDSNNIGTTQRDDIEQQRLTQFKNDTDGEDPVNDFVEEEHQHYSNTNTNLNTASAHTTTASTSWISTLIHNSNDSASDALEGDNSLPNERNNMETNTYMVSSETWKQEDGSSTEDNSSVTVDDDDDDDLVDELEGEYQFDSGDIDGNLTTTHAHQTAMLPIGKSKAKAEMNDQSSVRQERVLSSSEASQSHPALSSPSSPPIATDTEHPCNPFAQRFSPPPKKKPRVKRQWHERLDGQPPPRIIKWDDDEDDEMEADKSDNVSNTSEISIVDHTTKRRTLPSVLSPTPENAFSHRYQPPLTHEQRQEARQLSTSSPSHSSPSSARHTQRPESHKHSIISSPTRRKVYIYWTDDEVAALEEGLGYYRDRQWRKILTKYADRFAPGRTNMDLRDKARNEIKRRQIQGEDLGPFSYAL